MTIVLTGYMGSGKSSVGRQLSTLLNCLSIDLDTAIEQRQGCKVSDIFAREGEKEFRRIEVETLGEVLSGAQGTMILSLGGGTIMQPGAQELLRDVPKVYLRTSEATIRERLGARDESRPMMQKHDLGELLRQRTPVYEREADIIIDTDALSPEQIAVRIARRMGLGRYLECCCTSLHEALEAQNGGASRVELCEQLEIGGVTPSEEAIRSVVEALEIPVNVLVRPRGGNFAFDGAEEQAMLDSIRVCKEAGVNAVVIGALRKDGSVDMELMRRLIEAARPMQVTFHRAFDVCAEPYEAFDDIMALGCDRLLTSGHADNAFDGRWLIAELTRRAGGRIRVMAGCGVRPHNIAAIEMDSRADEYHSSAHGPEGTTDSSTVRELVFAK